MRDEKLYQTYLDLVMSKKIGTTPAERSRIADGIASFLTLRDSVNMPFSQPHALSNSRVDISATDSVQRARNHMLDGRREYDDARAMISPTALKVITSLFTGAYTSNVIGSQLTGLSPENKGNASANGAAVKQRIAEAGENLARYFARARRNNRP